MKKENYFGQYLNHFIKGTLDHVVSVAVLPVDHEASEATDKYLREFYSNLEVKPIVRHIKEDIIKEKEDSSLSVEDNTNNYLYNRYYYK